jgi:hypothetical protein
LKAWEQAVGDPSVFETHSIIDLDALGDLSVDRGFHR